MRKDFVSLTKLICPVIGAFLLPIGTDMNTSKRRERTRALIMLSLFTAIAFLSIYIVNFKVAFLTFDIKNVFITIAAMIYGPISGIIVSFAAALVEFIFHNTTGFYGFVMNFVSSASFAFLGAFFYRRYKTLAGSYLALGLATLGSTAFMMLTNLFITPFYMGVSMGEVAKMIPTLLFPFNLIKCLVNAAVVLILYKPISLALARAGVLKKEGNATYFNKKTLLTLVIALVLIAASLFVFFAVLGGKISFH